MMPAEASSPSPWARGTHPRSALPPPPPYAASTAPDRTAMLAARAQVLNAVLRVDLAPGRLL